MTDLFLKIHSQLQSKYPFAVFSKPGSDMVTGIFQNSSEAYFLTDFSQPGFVFAPFNGDSFCFIPEDKADILSVQFEADGYVPSELKTVPVDENEKTDFENLVTNCVAAIRQGDFDKLVASRTETAQLSNTDVTTIFQKLLYAYPMAYKYCFYHPESGLWMGATPEQLLKVENNTLHTVALAGTQVYKEGEHAVWENKEKEEQLFVTDYIVASLKEYADDIHTTAPYTFRAGNIVHIKTDISAELISTGILKDVLQKLHPTPAVCGLPKQEAKTFLIKNEGYNREYYSGFIGELNRDFATGQAKTDLFVNLRCMKVQGDKAQLYIGCGITKDSDPEKEFLETVNKSMTMRRVL
ncbi:isochorismate synthase [Flavobacterium cerinum]|uniref:isochorismate synthase n=1 Tax=Flavobacterium cerinum TaxID=2502784 RepID=A0A444GMN7_9FLAO|nr:isochorismate synthase [Flavobacterium cerinum]RWW92228.1 isochorismate synthase [Flavobacterium cerinum]